MKFVDRKMIEKKRKEKYWIKPRTCGQKKEILVQIANT